MKSGSLTIWVVFAVCVFNWVVSGQSDGDDHTSKNKLSIAYTEKLDTPDLTQTDPEGDLPDGGAHYCGPVSVSNSFIWLAENGFDNLAPEQSNRKRSQLELAKILGSKEYMNALDGGTGIFGIFRGAAKYIQEKGYEYEYFKYQGWRSHPRELECNVEVPKLDWLKEGLRDNGAVWLNVGWYKYDRKTRDYLRVGGHWVTLVGYGVDSNGKENPKILIIHDPSPRAGKGFAHEYVWTLSIKKGRLAGEMKGLPCSAKGYYKMGGGMHVKKTADFGILDGAVVLKLKKP